MVSVLKRQRSPPVPVRRVHPEEHLQRPARSGAARLWLTAVFHRVDQIAHERRVQRRDAARLFLLLFGLMLALVIGLAIPNLGTVFRKKAFALFPLFVMACSTSWRDVALMFRRTETPRMTTGRILDR